MEHCHCMSMWALHMQLQLHFKSYPIQMANGHAWRSVRCTMAHGMSWGPALRHIAPHFYM